MLGRSRRRSPNDKLAARHFLNPVSRGGLGALGCHWFRLTVENAIGMTASTAICPPDLTARPYTFTVERDFSLTPQVLFRAWTEQFDRWFASPGSVLMRAGVNEVFFFETQFEGKSHPHYGRFLKLEQDRLVEMTWLTGTPGTKGAETVVTVELTPHDKGTHLCLTHSGFPDEETMRGHADAWPLVFPVIEERFAGEK
jgi:uncharacterized protein YndB with AHSA1/START domain